MRSSRYSLHVRMTSGGETNIELWRRGSGAPIGKSLSCLGFRCTLFIREHARCPQPSIATVHATPLPAALVCLRRHTLPGLDKCRTARPLFVGSQRATADSAAKFSLFCCGSRSRSCSHLRCLSGSLRQHDAETVACWRAKCLGSSVRCIASAI